MSEFQVIAVMFGRVTDAGEADVRIVRRDPGVPTMRPAPIRYLNRPSVVEVFDQRIDVGSEAAAEAVVQALRIAYECGRMATVIEFPERCGLETP